MANLWQDLRFALRILAKNPGFTLIAVLTLALGIGANTAIFSVLDSVLLRSLPVLHPEQLVTLSDPDEHGSSFGSEGGGRSLLAYSEFEYFRDHNEVFSRIFAADSSLPKLEITISNSSSSAGVQKESSRVRLVSGDYFTTLGVNPAAGTFFTREVDRARDGSPIAVLSYALWKQRFGLDPLALGKTIQIRQTSFQIVGVTPPGFSGETVGEVPDLWIPMMMQDSVYPGRDLLTPAKDLTNMHIWLQVMARLKPGVTLEQAKASINVTYENCRGVYQQFPFWNDSATSEAFLDVQTFRPVDVSACSDLFPFLSHSRALFCTFLHAAKTQLVCFHAIPHSSLETT